MAKIYDTSDFPVKEVRLGTPFNKGGVFFIKMTVANAPIYIQPPKCQIKQGFVQSGKKIFCDLLFSVEDSTFLTQLEQIEELAKAQIFENRAKWFETELDEHDIENSLVSPYKMYKSGKMYIIRANIPNTLGKSDLKIYDESEQEILPEDLKEETNVITILELKGIKCSARSFQFDLDVRQMLVVSPVKLFEKCIIRKSSEPAVATDTRALLEETFDTTSYPTSVPEAEPEISETICHEPVSADDTCKRVETITAFEPSIDEICEFELDLDKIKEAETVQLKTRNDVYYKMYKDAKRKAKEAKMVALTNYLEAKRIKTTYFLEDSSDDESVADLEESFSQSKIPDVDR